MLRNRVLVAGIAAIAFGIAGCGSSTDTEGSDGAGGGSSSTGGDNESKVGLPPEPGPQKPGDGAGDTVFAVSKLYLGDTNRDGSPNQANGWKQYGFNLDGKVSTKDSTDLCKPAAGGSPSSVYPDGDNGIDNSFGKNILPIILGLASDASAEVNAGIAEGDFTIMLAMEALGADADYNPIVTRLYGGKDLGHPPKWDGTDAWPVIPELLSNPQDIKSSKIVFPQSYLRENLWVSGSKAPLTLNLTVADFTLSLTIGSALLAVKLDPDHKGGREGTIAGVLETEVLISEIKKVAGAFSKDLCSGSTIESIANQLRQASDILKDGTQDPNKTCDGISIGLGFDVEQVVLGPIAEPAQPGGNPCEGAQ